MRKAFFLVAFLVVGFLAFAEIPVFLNVDLSQDELADRVLTESVLEELDSSGVSITSGSLENPDTVEFMIRGLTLNYDGKLIGYTMAVAVVFHDPALVNQSWVTNITCNPNSSGLAWAAESAVEFFVALVQKAGLVNGSI